MIYFHSKKEEISKKKRKKEKKEINKKRKKYLRVNLSKRSDFLHRISSNNKT